MSVLFKARTYLVGHMQYADGREWRDYAEEELKKLNIIVFNPFDNPFIKDVDENEDSRRDVEKMMLLGYYDGVAERMREVRSHDLSLVDKSDFIIAHLKPSVASWGSAEEIVTAVRMKKPIFVSMEGGKSKTPQWMMGMFPHKYIYDSVEDIIEIIKGIDNGYIEINSDRWRLLKRELR